MSDTVMYVPCVVIVERACVAVSLCTQQPLWGEVVMYVPCVVIVERACVAVSLCTQWPLWGEVVPPAGQ